MLVRLVTGCSWEDAERLCGKKVSDTTVRARRDEWEQAGVFDAVAAEAISAYDKIIGLDLSDVAVDGSLHKSPAGGEGTGKNPTDRAKLGWKWSILTDGNGIPIGWAPTGPTATTRSCSPHPGRRWSERTARRHRDHLARPRLRLRAHRERLTERGINDAVIAKKRKRGDAHRDEEPSRWGCAGRSSGPTRGSRTSVSSGATRTARPSTASPSSPWPSSSCSLRSSSTGGTAGHRDVSLSAEPLSLDPPTDRANLDGRASAESASLPGKIVVFEVTVFTSTKEALSVSSSSRRIDRIAVTFDEPTLVADAGLSCRRPYGSPRSRALVNEMVRLGGRVGGASPGRKVLTLVAAILAGGTHIDHADRLRAGATGGCCRSG